MQHRFITLTIPHRQGEVTPDEVDNVFPIARGEIQVGATDELRSFCLVSGVMSDGDQLVGMSWPDPDPALRAHELLPYAQLALLIHTLRHSHRSITSSSHWSDLDPTLVGESAK